MAETDFGVMHHDPDLFRAALTHTEAESGFLARLIEKDYFCSLILHFLYRRKNRSLVFKGGTCLSKVYTEFYRLSEDLDFAIGMPSDATRSERRARVKPWKRVLSEMSARIPALRLTSPLEGHNLSTQYIAYLAYESAITGGNEQIKVEIDLREPLLRPGKPRPARTLLVSGFTKQPVIQPFDVVAIDIQEAYAEKCRAALTRREPAIRDLFDMDYGRKRLGVDVLNPGFISMVEKKLTVPGNNAVDASLGGREALARQLDSELRPVLRQADFANFDLDYALQAVYLLSETIDD
jgi:predicted nucleotidyltransferase component of viral defense system